MFNYYSAIKFLPVIVLAGLVFSCSPSYKIAETSDQTYRFNKSVNETDPGIDSLIAPYKARLDAEMNTVIGRAAPGLRKEKPESKLGNWVADAIRDYAVESGYPVDFAIQNFGGLRIGELPEGPVKLGQIFELMPFENNLVILEVNEQDLISFFNRIARYGGWPVSSEVRLTISEDLAKSISIAGNSLQQDKTYLVAMPDYIANGGDSCDFFEDNPRDNTGVLIRDVLIQAVKVANQQAKPIDAKKEGRIALENHK